MKKNRKIMAALIVPLLLLSACSAKNEEPTEIVYNKKDQIIEEANGNAIVTIKDKDVLLLADELKQFNDIKGTPEWEKKIYKYAEALIKTDYDMSEVAAIMDGKKEMPEDVASNDGSKPSKDKPKEEEIKITTEKESIKEDIAFRVIKEPSETLWAGDMELVEPGNWGLKETEYKLTYHNGNLHKEELIREHMVSKPKNEKINFGIKSGKDKTFTRELFESINTERKRLGLDPFEWNDDVAKMADTRAKEIMENYSHTRPNKDEWYQIDTLNRLSDELIARGYYSSTKVLSDWFATNDTNAALKNQDKFLWGATSVYRDESGEPFIVFITAYNDDIDELIVKEGV